MLWAVEREVVHGYGCVVRAEVSARNNVWKQEGMWPDRGIGTLQTWTS